MADFVMAVGDRRHPHRVAFEIRDYVAHLVCPVIENTVYETFIDRSSRLFHVRLTYTPPSASSVVPILKLDISGTRTWNVTLRPTATNMIAIRPFNP
jgi:hypothetical protein